MRSTFTALFPLRFWLAPVYLFVLATPFWLHVWEPQMFLAINQACASAAPPLVWTAFSLLGNGWGVLGLTAPLLLLAPRMMWAWLCAAPFAALFARSGKWFLVSPRPAAEIDNAQFQIVGDVLRTVSMPSGHTTTAVAVVTALVFSVPAPQRRPYHALWLLALGTGLSRMAVGAHWPGDVLVGMGLGWWAGLLGVLLLQRVPQAWNGHTHWSLRSVAVLLAGAVFMLLTDPLDFAENAVLHYLLAALGSVVLLLFVWRNVSSARPGRGGAAPY